MKGRENIVALPLIFLARFFPCDRLAQIGNRTFWTCSIGEYHLRVVMREFLRLSQIQFLLKFSFQQDFKFTFRGEIQPISTQMGHSLALLPLYKSCSFVYSLAWHFCTYTYLLLHFPHYSNTFDYLVDTPPKWRGIATRSAKNVQFFCCRRSN